MAAPCQSLNPCEDDFNLSDEEDLNSPFPDELQCFAVVTVAELERAVSRHYNACIFSFNYILCLSCPYPYMHSRENF